MVLISLPFISKILTDTFCGVGSENEMVVVDDVGFGNTANCSAEVGASCVFDEDERAFVLTLGVMCAQAIMRAHLRVAEKAASHASVLAQEVAELANKSKAHYLATISHDLRTPMNAVIGYTQLIADELYGPVTPLQREHLERISASGKHLLGLVEQILSHARIEASQETVELGDVELSVLLEQSLGLVRPLAERKGQRVRTAGTVPPLRLRTDAGKVRQILVNLLGNALKFSDSGDVVLTTRTEGVVKDTQTLPG